MKTTSSVKQDGESKLSSAAGSTSGAGEAGTNENVPTVESSATLPPNGKPRTKRGAGLTIDQALQILQQSIINCQGAGVRCQVTPIYDRGEQMIAVVLHGVKLDSGNLIADIGTSITSSGKGE